MRTLVVFSAFLFIAASAAAQVTHPNILLIIADDLGVDKVEAYNGRHSSPYVTVSPHTHTQAPDGHPHTPTISGLAADGILFLDAWANPVCAATRATMQTGLYGHRTGILGPTGHLDFARETIPEVLAIAAASTPSDTSDDYQSALIGKWGLTNSLATGPPSFDENGGANHLHAVQSGYDYYAGSPMPVITGTYFSWTRRLATFDPGRSNCDGTHVDTDCIDYSTTVPVDDPNTSADESYATSVQVTDAENWIDAHTLKPWFLVLAFNAPHTPYHVPPASLYHDLGLGAANANCPAGKNELCYDAAIEAMDTEIGRLLTHLGTVGEASQTIVIFVGDNGSPIAANSKGTLYEGGVNVPFIVKGPGVASSGTPGQPRFSEALVNASDLFTTVLKLAHVDTTAISLEDHDSYSIVPILSGLTPAIRHFEYAEYQTTDRAIRNRDGLKLRRTLVDSAENWFLYDLKKDPHEATNLVYQHQSGPVLTDPNPPTTLVTQLGELAGLLVDPNHASAPNIPAANSDEDDDGIANASDNCRELPQDVGQDCDTDQDGYGNMCDGDFDNDAFTSASDFSIWNTDFTTTGLDSGRGTDMNCDGYVDGSDWPFFSVQYTSSGSPGPSGLACAGTSPCP